MATPYACWSKTIRVGDEYHERKYVVRTDASIITRFDRCDLQRSHASFKTDGWQEYHPKRTPNNTADAIRMVAGALEPDGYTRRF